MMLLSLAQQNGLLMLQSAVWHRLPHACMHHDHHCATRMSSNVAYALQISLQADTLHMFTERQFGSGKRGAVPNVPLAREE